MARGGLAWLAAPFLLAALGRLPLSRLGTDDVSWPRGITDDRTMLDSYRTVSAPRGDWVLVMGGSSAYFAFDRDTLGHPVHKQTFSRGFPSDVALALSWDLHRTLPEDQRPARVVWGLTLASLVDRKGDAIHPCTTAVARSRPDPAMLARTGVCDDLAAWSGPLDRIGQAFGRLDPWYVRRATTEDLAASWTRRLLGRPLPEPGPDVWLGYEGRDAPRYARNTRAWEQFGVFDVDAISPPLGAMVGEVGRLCAEAGIPLTIVSMPEPADIRGRYAPGARERFEALLAASGADVLDLWEAVPDEDFFDQVHVNAEGRVVTTARLRAYLDEKR